MRRSFSFNVHAVLQNSPYGDCCSNALFFLLVLYIFRGLAVLPHRSKSIHKAPFKQAWGASCMLFSHWRELRPLKITYHKPSQHSPLPAQTFARMHVRICLSHLDNGIFHQSLKRTDCRWWEGMPRDFTSSIFKLRVLYAFSSFRYVFPMLFYVSHGQFQ